MSAERLHHLTEKLNAQNVQKRCAYMTKISV